MIVKELRNEAAGASEKLEWRFVAEHSEQGGEILGRIIYGAFEDQPQAMNIFRFMVSETAEHRDHVGLRLLKESMVQLQAKGVKFATVEFHLYSGNSDAFKQYAGIFKSAGFQIIQEKSSLEVAAEHWTTSPIRLTFKSLELVGEAKFIEAITRVTEGTLDRDDLSLVAAHGPTKAAMDYYSMLREMDFNEKWWRLAYDEQEELVGLVVPQLYSEDCGVINYIGVVPEKRGKGYVKDIVSEACQVMLGAGMSKVMADIDQQNLPLEKALLHHGFSETRQIAILKCFIDHIR